MSILHVDADEYRVLLISVQRRLAERRRGTQQQISYDLRVPATQVSQVVKGDRVDVGLLSRVDVWLAEHPEGEVTTA